MTEGLDWDLEADVVVLGSGGAAMTAAISAHDFGAGEVVILERSGMVGGTTAMSGGMLWIPNNPYQREAGIADSEEDIVAYLDARLSQVKSLRGSDIPIDDVDAFVVFQRLREIDVLFDGVLRERYRVARIEGRVSNGWLDCPDFIIERVPTPAARRRVGKAG